MSEQDKVDVGSLKDTFLECPVCVEHFNLTDRRPRLLHSCLHAFCTQCLQQLLNKEGRGKITCPLCRKVEKVTGNADTLEVDSLRDKLVEFLQIKQDKKVLCSECLEKTAAVSRCEECQSYLCKECDFVHRRHRVSRDHSILSLNDVLKQPIQSFGKGHFCPNHPKHHLEFYCATEEKLCCVSCTVLDHRDHELQKLEEAAATRKEELDTKIKQVHARANRLREERKDGTQELKCIEEAKARSILDINRIFHELKQRLDNRKRGLIENVQRNSSSLSSVINKTMASHEQTLAMIESTDTYFAQAKQKADAVEMLEIYPSIKRSIDSLLVQRQSSKTRGNEDVYNIQFKPTKYENVLCLMREFGTFTKLPQSGEMMILKMSDLDPT
ncbi:E3 ubiquitin-protein ligase TRIM33-like [Haliotis cracherodii]|uniref:E3 ubiquitin-protein ligase TRIM33-like n=1 Tax=Haliotis cracherodii TaxID=6455 RepID=UPI0039ED7064